MITIQNLTKSYAKGTHKAVDDLSLETRRGEIFGFIGPNGAGKTTTIKTIIGVTIPDSGHILIDGIDMAQHPIEAKQRIGFVPDTHEMFDRLTGQEYLDFVADVYGVSADDRKKRMAYYLEMFEIAQVVSQYVRSYSHGMKQKLMLVGALLHQPPLWVLDEPMTGLDPQAMKRLKDVMHEHCNAGNTVFFSSHVLDVVERLCDRIGIISRGKLLAVGTLEELRAREHEASLESVFLDMTESGSGEPHA